MNENLVTKFFAFFPKVISEMPDIKGFFKSPCVGSQTF
jgi:hypothetical protein